MNQDRKVKRGRQQAAKKGIKLEIDYQKLGEMLMPRLTEAVTQNLPNMQTYEKAIGELNMANRHLKDLNDKLVGEFSQSLEEQDKRLRAIEAKLGIESPPDLSAPPAEPPAEAPQNPA